MTIKEDTPDIDSVEILLQYMDEFKHSGQNRAAAKLIRQLMAPVSAPSAPLVAVSSIAIMNLIDAQYLNGSIRLTWENNKGERTLTDVCKRFTAGILEEASQVSPQSFDKFEQLNSGQVAPQATVEPKFQELCDAMDSAATEAKYQRAAENLKDAVLGFASPAVQATVEPLTDALKSARKALEHDVPESCWATGPLTGDPFEDLIVCPGCRAVADIDRALLDATPPTSKATEQGRAQVWAETDANQPQSHGQHQTVGGHNLATNNADTGEVSNRIIRTTWNAALEDAAIIGGRTAEQCVNGPDGMRVATAIRALKLTTNQAGKKK